MDHATLQRIRSAGMLSRQTAAELDELLRAMRRAAATPPVNLARALAQMSRDGLEGQEREFAQETAKQDAAGYNPHRLYVPWQVMRRDLSSTDSAGGYAIGVDVPVVVDILRPFSTVLRGGVSVLEGLSGDTVLPNTSATSTVAWMANETSAATPADPTLAGTTMLPKIAIGVIQASRHFQRQAGDPESFIRRELLRTAGAVVDTAVLVGSASSGQPRGLVNLASISTVSGTSFAYDDALAMKDHAADADADESQIAFIGAVGVRTLLENRERAAGSGFIWDGGKVASCNAYASTLMASASLLSGPMSRCYVGFWGSGFVVEANPYDPVLFKSGITQWRVVVACDVAIACPQTAFCKSTSIS